jgi:hypothetical protein
MADPSSQAYATREDFAQQRTMLQSINSRMGGVLSGSSLPVRLPFTIYLTDIYRSDARDQLVDLHDPFSASEGLYHHGMCGGSLPDHPARVHDWVLTGIIVRWRCILYDLRQLLPCPP